MPLDPAIPLGFVTPSSPFDAIKAPIDTASGLLSLKKNQMELGANQAISQAYSQSIDPQTGQVDFGKLQTLAAQSGAGAFLPQFMGQLAQQRNSQLQYQQGQLDMALKQRQAITGRIGALALDPRMGKEDMSGDIASQISDSVQEGLLPLDVAVREIKSMPSDPKSQSMWIQNHLYNSVSNEAKLQAMMPQNIAVQTGAGTELLNRNPITGQSAPGAFVQSGLSPSELAAPKTIIGPNGEQRQVTTAEWLQMQGQGGGMQPQGGQPLSGYTGRYQQSQGAPGVQAALSPGQAEAMSSEASASNSAAQTLHNAAADAPMRINLLNTARDALSSITTGPGTDWQNTFKSALNSSPVLGAALRTMGAIDPQNIARYDDFKKILTNYASSVSGSLGTGTDARLNAAVTGNANPNISNLANQDILAKTIAAEKMRAAQDAAFQNSGLTTDKFNQWQSKWNSQVDPATFVYAEMNPSQRAEFQKRMTPQQLENFKNSFNALVSGGILKLGQ